MSDFFGIQPEEEIRLIGFVAVVIVLLLLEKFIPLSVPHQNISVNNRRTICNLSLQGINVLLLLLLPITLLSVSLFALLNTIGLFNIELTTQFHLGLWSKIIICWFVMDFSMYWLHRLYHRVDFLWKIHRVHHSDMAVDLTTTFRTHPFEILITLLVKASIVLLLGMPIIGVVTYEIIICAMALFIHSDIRVHGAIEKVARLFFITPNLHRIHHSSNPADYQSNFGVVLSIWDRLFSTLKLSRSDISGEVGIKELIASEQQRMGSLLTLPLR